MLLDSVLDGLSVSEWTEKRREILQRAQPEQRFWVVEDESQTVGFLDTGPSRDGDTPAAARSAEIYALYLHPRSWGRGLGRALMERALEDLRHKGWSQAHLWVLDQNLHALNFYKAAGFVTDGATRPGSFRGCSWLDVRCTLPLN